MKVLGEILAAVLIAAASASLHAQGTFRNLDFERARIVPDPTSPYYPYELFATNGIPGWTAYFNSTPRDRVLYNNTGLDAPSVSVFDAYSSFSLQPIQGNYSIYLKPSATRYPPFYSASIGQTAQVPYDALSLRFLREVNSGFDVSFGGQPIPLVQLGTSGNYVIMGGDISMFAGQTSELLFTGAGLFDSIQFFNLPIPEPSSLSLLGLAALFLGWRLRSRHSCG